MTKQAELIAYLFDGQVNQFSKTLLGWVEASTRYAAFVDIYRDKIRKKIRLSRVPESLLDLRSELEIAYCLLNDRRLAVAYEPYASTKRRGPDFAVTYRTNLVFNIEAARIRGKESGTGGTELQRKEERILRIFLDKLGQMQPGMANLLVIHVQEGLAKSIDLDRLMREIKTRAEKKEPSLYALSRYTSPPAFYKDFLHLSGILLWPGSGSVWVNKQARPGLEEKVFRLVSSLLGGGNGDW